MKRRLAFTLVELLLVIAVLGVVFGLLMGTARGSRTAELQIDCLMNLKSIHQVVTGYATSNRGLYPAPLDPFTGRRFTGPYVTSDTWAGMPHVRALKNAGAGAEMFFCPFDHRYGDWDRWPLSTWEAPDPMHWGARDRCFVYVGYTLFWGRSSGRFTNGLLPAADLAARDDVPLAADTVHLRPGGLGHGGGWYHSDGGPGGRFDAGANTLFKSGRVVFTPIQDIDPNESAFVLRHDRSWCALK